MARGRRVTLKGLEGELLKQASKVMQNIEPELVDYGKDFIKSTVYEAGTPKRYQRTQGFLNSLTSNFTISGNAARVKVSHKDNHFKPYQDENTRRYFLNNPNFMPHIVHEGLSGAKYGDGFWRRPRPYFTQAEKELRQGDFKDMFAREYRNLGGRLG